MPLIQVRRLSEKDCAAVVAVERAIYPPDLQEPVELITERLRYEDDEYSSLNLGLYDDERLVGYILGHLDDGSDYPELAIGDNLYIADIAVLPTHRRHLAKLGAAFGRESMLEYPGIPIVAHTLGATADMWSKHANLFAKHGFAMTRRVEGQKTRGDHAAVLAVWEQLPGARPRGARMPGEQRRNVETLRTSRGRELGVRVVIDEETMLTLAPAWRALEQAVPDLTVFQTFDYQAAWVRAFGVNRKLMVVCIYEGDEIIGIAPLQVSAVEMHGRTLQHLSFLGAPWEVDRPTFLFARHAEDCGEAVARALLQRRGSWDVIWFHEQIAGSPALETFCDTLRARGILHGRIGSSHCPWLDLRGSWPALLASKSQKFRKNLKASRRKLEAEGPVEYETVAGDAARLHALFDEYEALELRSWKHKDGVGVTQSHEHLRFHRKLVDAFGPTGGLVFRSLRVGGKLVAATFGLVHRRRFYSQHIAYDDAYEKASPGTYLESLELEECFGADLDEYDFLGGFLTNKVRWASGFRDTVEVHLYQRQPRLIAAWLWFFVVKPPLRRVLARIGVTKLSKPREDRVVD